MSAGSKRSTENPSRFPHSKNAGAKSNPIGLPFLRAASRWARSRPDRDFQAERAQFWHAVHVTANRLLDHETALPELIKPPLRHRPDTTVANSHSTRYC